MWKRTKENSKNSDSKKHVTKERFDFSDTAIKAMYGEMAAICMTMGLTYGVYMPITPLWYDDSSQ